MLESTPKRPFFRVCGTFSFDEACWGLRFRMKETPPSYGASLNNSVQVRLGCLLTRKHRRCSERRKSTPTSSRHV